MKKLLAILLVVATLFCIVACGKDNNGDSTTTSATQNTTTVPSSTATTTVVDPSNTETTTVVDPSNTETTTVPNPDDKPTTTTTTKTTTSTEPAPTPAKPDHNDSNNWDKVVNGVFTSDKGGLQMKAEGWKTYAVSGLSFVPSSYNNTGLTNAVCLRVYDAEDPALFADKDKKIDTENVLGAALDSFSATTVDGYPAYKAVLENQMYVWVVNTPTYKYFINFMQAPSPYGTPIASTAASMMSTVEIYK